MTALGAADARILGVAGSHQLRQAMDVHVAPIDPRDQSWEVPQPAYRVYFHDARGASYEYEVSGANVKGVLEWADAESGDRTYVLYACATMNGLGLLRLQGHDPNENVAAH
jgi:hypothetical protein